MLKKSVSEKVNIGVDLGGVNTKIGIVDSEYKVLEKRAYPTKIPKTPEEICEKLSTTIAEMLKNQGIPLEKVNSIGLCTPGAMDTDNGVLRYCSTFDWYDIELVGILSEYLPGPEVYLENDANAALLAEMLAGAGVGFANGVLVTIGHGIGAGIMIDGHIYSGSSGGAGEVGHMVIDVNGPMCVCGRKGCFEVMASGRGLVRMIREAMMANPKSTLWQISGGSIDNFSGKLAFDGALMGDKTASEVMERFFDYLSAGLSNIVNIFEPQVLILGGGVSVQGDALIEPVKARVKFGAFLKGKHFSTEIRAAKLGPDAGIIGASALYKIHQ